MPKEAYFKDVDGILNQYIGTWIGTRNSITYEFVISKHLEHYRKVAMDILKIRYKITNQNGEVIATNYNETINNSMIIDGNYPTFDKKYYNFTYRGYNMECGQSGSVNLKNEISDPNKIQLVLMVTGGSWSTCEGEDAEQVLPTQWLTITKQ